MEEGEEGDSTDDGIRLGDLSALLQGIENGIFRELEGSCQRKAQHPWSHDKTDLLIELVSVVAGLVGDLNEDRMLLHFLRGRHLEQPL